jgi:hypothetical protein
MSCQCPYTWKHWSGTCGFDTKCQQINKEGFCWVRDLSSVTAKNSSFRSSPFPIKNDRNNKNVLCTINGMTHRAPPCKTKHAAQCHAPRCKGYSTAEGKSMIRGLRKQVFKTQRGISQHEQIMHPVERNEKQTTTAAKLLIHRPCRGYGRVWRKA